MSNFLPTFALAMLTTIEDIPVEIERKWIRSMRMTICPPDARVHLSVPIWLSEADAREFVQSKWQWICRTRERVLARAQEQQHSYVTGETHYLLGRAYQLLIEPVTHGRNTVELRDEHIVMHCRPNATTENRKAQLREWYREQLAIAISPLMDKWTDILHQPNICWTIKEMKRAWGNCRPTERRIVFNLELAHEPIECIEYIVVHEMTHLDVANHGPQFKALMLRRLPNWKILRKQLNKA